MAKKPTHEELEQRIKELEREALEHKRVEKALWESEEKYRVFFETAKDAVFLCDEAGRFVDANQAACESLGYSKEELLKLSNKEIDADAKGYEAFLKVRDGLAEELTFEVNQRRKDGSLLPVEITGNFFKGKGQKIGIAIARDIALRKQAEEVLRDSQGKLDAMLQSIGDHMSMMDEELNIVWTNKIAKKIFGTNIIGKKCYEVYHKRKEPCEPYPCITLKAFQDGKVHEHDTEVIGKDGKTIFFHCTASVALKDENGKPATVIEISRDITEQKQAKDALQETRDYLENLINHANAPIIVWDREGRITLFNYAFERLTGYAADKVIGQEIRMLFPEEKLDESLSRIESALAGEYWESVEIPILCKDGNIRIVLWNSSNMYAEEGKTILTTVAQGVDITDRVRAAEKKKELEAQLRQAQKMEAIGTLAGGIAHDFNNILGAIMGYTELAQLDAGDSPLLKARLDKILLARVS